MKDAPFLNLVLALVMVTCLGWLLYIGRGLLLPIFTAVIAVYVMHSLTEALQRVPLLKHLPEGLLRLLVLVLFTLVMVLFAIVVAATIRDISEVAPAYQANLEALLAQVASRYDMEVQEIWAEVRAVTIDRLDVRNLILRALGGFTSVGATVFFVVIYAAFLMAERQGFARKIATALPNEDTAQKALRILGDIDRKVSDYLSIKTLINLILGTISFVILRALGVDFALFWALVIALLNYIPYVGSYIGVAFPVLLSLAQFGSIGMTLLVAALLTAVSVVYQIVWTTHPPARRLPDGSSHQWALKRFGFPSINSILEFPMPWMNLAISR